MLRKFYKATFTLMSNNLSEKLANIGLKKTTIQGTLKNESLSSSFESILERNKIEKAEKSIGNNLYHLVTKSSGWMKDHQIDCCVQNILDGRLGSRTRVDLAIEYFKLNSKSDSKSDENEFNKFCGVGIEVSNEELQKYLNNFIEENFEEMVKTKPNNSTLMAKLRKGIQFVEPKDLIMGFNKIIKGSEFKERLQKAKGTTNIPDKKKKKKKTKKKN